MTIKELINDFLKIKESYQLPEKMMECLMNKDSRVQLFDRILESYPSTKSDIMFEYFQEEHGNRKGLKQDFTPGEICEIVARLSRKNHSIYDVCSGTGGLAIKQINNNPDAYYTFEEISERTVPILLLNLAIRNIEGIVKVGDSLKMEYRTFYRLRKTEKYSEISEIAQLENFGDEKVDLVISNPPYSLTWKQADDYRFENYGLAPRSKADYAFILHGLSKLKDDGEMYAILPHGILFRGGAEGKIRQKLIENNLIDMVIGLPPNMFLNTDIPTLILKLKKNREDTDILFIDASKECEKVGRFNEIYNKHIETIISASNLRKPVKMLAEPATREEIEENEYNLNIPRYVDTFAPEPVPDLKETLSEYLELSEEIAFQEQKFFAMLGELVGTDHESQKELQEVKEKIQEHGDKKMEQLRLIV